ncbi:LysM peptidoglycan-binding domain-containing protein [uncultured Thiodictyon sp.]|uniref:LysM peptidoglycan-binding domain-containing protein n=1 Tax=uncultured Thiodictyon sp. TaxID=1846217 RepID=UPI0026001EB6|nr:LysM peptidoglycan-binding domain-containing protein [uncultured Thiodictyon sp.]
MRDGLRPTRASARGGPGALVYWGALGLGLALLAIAPGTTLGARAQEAPARPPPPSAQVGDQAQLPDHPAVQLGALSERVHGLEVKLRESAAARKAADQARMEAERRLAEGVQEIDLLRDAKTALEARLMRVEEQLAAAEAQVGRLITESAAQAQEGVALEHQLEQLKADQQGIEAAHQARLREAQVSQADLRAQLLERDARLQVLRAQVPAPAGGALTLEAAQAQSAAAAAALREALARAGGSGDPQARQALRAAEQRLHHHQFIAAQVAGARSVYQIRPADTLVVIANHFYGDGSRWRAIREANRNVLSDSKRLTPGLTLVIP